MKVKFASGHVQTMAFEEYWEKIPDSYRVGAKALYFCYQAFGREYPNLSVIPMNYGGYTMCGPKGRRSLIMMMNPVVLKALLYKNFEVFSNYLYSHGMYIEDFLSEEDMDIANRNHEEGDVEEVDDGGLPVIIDEGTPFTCY